CSRKIDCARAADENHWLWSRNGKCMSIESANPSNMSSITLNKVTLSLAPTITLKDEDGLMCEFGDVKSFAVLEEDGTVSCPPPTIIPPTQKGKDSVNVTVSLYFERKRTFFANFSYPFYDCKEAMYLSENLPCISCVTSQWNCQWDLHNHKCEESAPKENVLKQNMEEDCPQFFQPDPSIIPMDRKTTITFQGKNLDIYKDLTFTAGNDERGFNTAVMENSGSFSIHVPEFSIHDKETTPLNIYIKVNDKKIDSKLNVNLYNCFYGRSDCSLCLAADSTYDCVWCGDKCAYRKMCNDPVTSECPAPEITDFEPKAAPLNGGILLTIKGSNLGISSDDVESIKVAGVGCAFKKEFYSVSNR
ncbi:plexin-B2, partial [Bombina bombina]|uniref:plexin-B2 n=1 Tax=Bombina bombina TaxID=8345 RepID=UPI00235B2FDD